jgi:hypothetical protein
VLPAVCAAAAAAAAGVLLSVQEPSPRHVAVKEVVLPFNKFPGADTLLGPEMRSTGEVMGIDYDFASSYAKAQIAAGELLLSGRFPLSPPACSTQRSSVNHQQQQCSLSWCCPLSLPLAVPVAELAPSSVS